MRTIAHLRGKEFLRAINNARNAVGNLMAVANIAEIRKTMPKFTGNETDEEKAKILREQAKKNISAMLDSLLETHLDETYDCLMALCIWEPIPAVIDEETKEIIIPAQDEPEGLDLIGAVSSLLADKRVLDFLLQLGKLGLSGTGA